MMRLALLLLTLTFACTDPPAHIDAPHWRGTFTTSDAVVADAANEAAEEWRRASGDRVVFAVVLDTGAELTKYDEWTIVVDELPRSRALGASVGPTVVIKPGLSRELMFDVMLHELGHVAGLDHHPAARGHTMSEKVCESCDAVDADAVAALEGVEW